MICIKISNIYNNANVPHITDELDDKQLPSDQSNPNQRQNGGKAIGNEFV